MIEGLVHSLDTPEAKVAERARLKQHAREVVQPGFDYFHDKFTGELAYEVNLLRLAGLCNPTRAVEIPPTAEDLDELKIFKCIGSSNPLVSLQALKRELHVYLAKAADLNVQQFNMDEILPFFNRYSEELPNWGLFASLLC